MSQFNSKNFLIAVLQGGVYSGLVGGTVFSFFDTEWSLKNQYSLSMLFMFGVVPFGLGWNVFNKFLLKKIGSRPEMAWNFAISDKKAIMLDLFMNNIVFHSFYAYSFYKYSQYTSLDKIKNEQRGEETLTSPENHKSEWTSEENIIQLIKTRAKLTAVNYILEIWGPWMSDQYLKNKKVRLIKGMIISTIWDANLIHSIRNPYSSQKSVPKDKIDETHK